MEVAGAAEGASMSMGWDGGAQPASGCSAPGVGSDARELRRKASAPTS